MAITMSVVAGASVDYETQVIPPGIITGMTVEVFGNPSEVGDLWCTAFISPVDSNDAGSLATLVAGYPTLHNPLTWTGIFELKDSGYLVLETSGNPYNTVTIRATANRITLTRDGSLTQFLQKIATTEPK